MSNYTSSSIMKLRQPSVQTTQKWWWRVTVLGVVLMVATTGQATRTSWQRFGSSNNRKTELGESNTSAGVKRTNYRHISLAGQGSRSSVGGSNWKKWFPPITASSSQMYSPYLYRARQHNNNNNANNNGNSASNKPSFVGLDGGDHESNKNDGNCTKYARNCHDCLRHDCSFLQCDGLELPSTICLNVNSPSLFSRPSIHKIISQCHFIEQCPSAMNSLSSSSRWTGLNRGTVTKSPFQSLSSDPYSQRNFFAASPSSGVSSSAATAPNDSTKVASTSSQTARLYGGGVMMSMSMPHRNSSTSSSSSHSSADSEASESARGRLSQSSSAYSDDSADDSTDLMSADIENDPDNLETLQPNVNRKRVSSSSFQRYSPGVQARRHSGTPNGGDAIVASALVADENSRRALILSPSTNLHRGSVGAAVYIGLGTIIALVVCSTLVLSAVITVAYKKITKIYRNNHSGAYGALEDE